MNSFLKIMTNPQEPSRLKFDMVNVLVDAVQRASNLQQQQQPLDQSSNVVDIRYSPLVNYLNRIRSNDDSNKPAVDAVWHLIRSTITLYDQRLRSALTRLYHAIWGTRPRCYNKHVTVANIDMKVIPANNNNNAQQPTSTSITIPITPTPSTTATAATQPFSAPKKTKKRVQEDSDTQDSSDQEQPQQTKKKKKTNLAPITITHHHHSSIADDEPITATATPKIKITGGGQTTIVQQPLAPISNSSSSSTNKSPAVQEKSLMDARSEERISRKQLPDAWDDLICISMPECNVAIYAIMDNTPTGNALFRSLPITSPRVQGDKGLIYFELPGMEMVQPEDSKRSLVKNGELAYWVQGNGLCIGYSKTIYSKSNEIRLYEPCNVFADCLYKVKNLNKTLGPHSVHIQRCKRFVATFHELDNLQIHIDAYHHLAPFKKWIESLQKITPICCRVSFYGALVVFSMGDNFEWDPNAFDNSSPEVSDWYRNTISYGEVAFWEKQKSIIIGSGKSELLQDQKKGQIALTEKCYVIGRVISNNYIPLGEAYLGKDMATTQHTVTLDERTVEISVYDIKVTATLLPTRTADLIWRNLPIECDVKGVFGDCIIAGCERIKTELEKNTSKIVVEVGDLAFWCQDNSILMPYGPTLASTEEDARPRFAEECNIWARVDPEFKLPEMFKNAGVNEQNQVLRLDVYRG
ncbi:hypothetical protein AKO1_011415 [Acrasis kona]|uniref:Cyclophilin TM1367-like domain-containing protein n=1 Tax=Acrasis kona TaxID=1008807 RepID=A0AAW2ZKM3_9EUKA